MSESRNKIYYPRSLVCIIFIVLAIDCVVGLTRYSINSIERIPLNDGIEVAGAFEIPDVAGYQDKEIRDALLRLGIDGTKLMEKGYGEADGEELKELLTLFDKIERQAHVLEKKGVSLAEYLEKKNPVDASLPLYRASLSGQEKYFYGEKEYDSFLEEFEGRRGDIEIIEEQDVLPESSEAATLQVTVFRGRMELAQLLIDLKEKGFSVEDYFGVKKKRERLCLKYNFSSTESHEGQFKKVLNPPQDWTGYNSFHIVLYAEETPYGNGGIHLFLFGTNWTMIVEKHFRIRQGRNDLIISLDKLDVKEVCVIRSLTYDTNMCRDLTLHVDAIKLSKAGMYPDDSEVQLSNIRIEQLELSTLNLVRNLIRRKWICAISFIETFGSISSVKLLLNDVLYIWQVKLFYESVKNVIVSKQLQDALYYLFSGGIINPLVFLIANILLLKSGRRIATRFPVDNIFDYYLIVGVLFAAHIIFVLMVLGLFGWISIMGVAAASFVIFLSSRFIMRPGPESKGNLQVSRDYLYELLKSLCRNKLQLFSVSCIFVVYFILFMRGLINPPIGYDGIAYHIPFAVEWLKSGSLQYHFLFSDVQVLFAYVPSSGSLFMLWLLLPFHSDVLVSLVQYPFLIAIVICSISICYKLKVKEANVMYAVILFLSMPTIADNVPIAYVDVISAALILLLINFILCANRNKTKNLLPIVFLCIALLSGTKIVNQYWIVTLVPLVIFVACKTINRTSREIIKYILLFAAIYAVFGGFWFIKNVISTGNPFYPVLFNLPIIGSLPAGYNETFRNSFIHALTIFETHVKHLDFTFLPKFAFMAKDYGLQLFVVILPVISIGLIWSFLKYVTINKHKDGLFFLYLYSLPFLMCFVYIAIPGSGRWAEGTPDRYLVGCFIFASILTVYHIDQIKHKMVRSLISLSLIIVSLISILAYLEYNINSPINFILDRYGVVSHGIILSIIIILLVKLRIIDYAINIIHRENERIKIGYILMITVFLLTAIYSYYYELNKYNFYSRYYFNIGQTFSWLDENTQESNIAIFGVDRSLPLYGKKLSNNVYYITPSSEGIKPYHEYQTFNKKGLRDFRYKPEYESWLKNLQEKDINYIVARMDVGQAEALEIEWMKNNEDIFEKVYDARFSVFKINSLLLAERNQFPLIPKHIDN